MNEEILELIGSEPGATSMILVGVHGDEICGVKALENLLPKLKIEKGCVYIGYGNPRAIEKNVRYTEANLNRMFKADNLLSEKDKQSYEYERAQFLKPYMDKSEVLLDVHASSIPDSKPFIICEANAEKIIKYLPVDIIVSGFDVIEPGGTDFYMNNMGKTGICIECGYINNDQSVKIAEDNILAFLKANGHISEGNKILTKHTYIRMHSLYITKTDRFSLSKPFENFEAIQENQIIGIDGAEIIQYPHKNIILFAHDCNTKGDEAFLLGEIKNLA